MILDVSPPDQPRITIRARAPEPRPAPIFRLRFSRARTIPKKPGIGHGPTPPHSARRVAPRSGQTAWRPLATAAPIEGLDHTTMSKPTMTTTNPGLPMARAHPTRGTSPWPTLTRSGQGPHATATAPSCPLPRRTAGIPGRPAPTWEELLGQR